MTGKVTLIFPGFQGFPGAVGTLGEGCTQMLMPRTLTTTTMTHNGQSMIA